MRKLDTIRCKKPQLRLKLKQKRGCDKVGAGQGNKRVSTNIQHNFLHSDSPVYCVTKQSRAQKGEHFQFSLAFRFSLEKKQQQQIFFQARFASFIARQS